VKPAFLLDTNILSDLIRNPQGSVYRKIAEVGESSICTNWIVAGEIRFGVLKKDSPALRRQAEAVLGVMPILTLESGIDHHYAQIRLDLEERGEMIGPNDLWIAAHTRTLNLTLITANETEFRRVPGLLVENWLGGG